MMMTTMINVQNNDDDSDIKHAIISNDNKWICTQLFFSYNDKIYVHSNVER